MPKPQGFCIYCGGPGLTQEHLFPDWLKLYIPRKHEHTEINLAVLAGPAGEEKQKYTKSGDPFSHRLRIVCKICNTGWMSALQTEAKPILRPLIHGEDSTLTPDQQRILGRWVAMTILTIQYVALKRLGPDNVYGINQPASPQEQRDFVRTNDAAPESWTIWIGRIVVDSFSPVIYNASAVPTLDEIMRGEIFEVVRAPNAHATTLRMSQLYITVVDHPPIASFANWRFRTHLRHRLIKIWPPRTETVTWPRSRVIERRHAIEIAFAFHRHVAELNQYPL